MAKLALSDNGRTPATYTRIQTIEALEDNRPHQSASNPPPDMTPEDFPTLVSSPNNSAQQPKQPKNPKKPHEKPRPVAIAKKKSQPGRGHTEKGILDDLEDTEAILYNEARRRRMISLASLKLVLSIFPVMNPGLRLPRGPPAFFCQFLAAGQLPASRSVRAQSLSVETPAWLALPGAYSQCERGPVHFKLSWVIGWTRPAQK